MPRAEDNKLPRGQAYGQRAQQEEFLTATQPPAPEPAPPVAQAAAGSRPPIGQDMMLNELLDAATGPTDRPEEPVTTGLSEFLSQDIEELEEWLPVLVELASDPNAPPIIKQAAARASLLTQRGR